MVFNHMENKIGEKATTIWPPEAVLVVSRTAGF